MEFITLCELHFLLGDMKVGSVNIVRLWKEFCHIHMGGSYRCRWKIHGDRHSITHLHITGENLLQSAYRRIPDEERLSSCHDYILASPSLNLIKHITRVMTSNRRHLAPRHAPIHIGSRNEHLLFQIQ